MGTRKDIGKAFNEKFKDFEQAPDAGVWDAIASELDGKPRGFIIPLWLRFGSVVILLGLIGLLVWQPWNVTTDEDASEQQLTEQSDAKGTQKETSLGVGDSENLANTTTEKNTSTEDNNNLDNSKTVNTEAGTNAYSNTENNAAKVAKAITKETIGTTANASNSTNTVTGNTSTPTITNTSADTTTNANNTIVNTNKRQQSRTNTTTNTTYTQQSFKGNNTTIGGNTNFSSKTLADTNGPFAINEQTKAILEKRKEKEREAHKAYNTKIQAEKAEMDNAIAEQQAINKKFKDSLSSAKKKVSEEALAETKDEKKGPRTDAEKAQDRQDAVEYEFAISPYTSLISYGSLTKGSSIDDRLNDNPREGINTLGYGVRVEYTLSERSSIRFGVGIAPLKYRTNNFQVFNNGGIINIYQLAGLTPLQLSAGGNPVSPEATAFFNDNTVVTLEQNISYIDIPIDYKYKLINKRIGLSINPGLNIFLLTENDIYAISDGGERLKVGSERSLNELSFGLNLGLSTHYNFTKNWRLDIEPTFKYQINPYSTSLGNFKPYYFGVQFGMTYKF